MRRLAHIGAGLAAALVLLVGAGAAQAAPLDYQTAYNNAVFWTYVDITPWVKGCEWKHDYRLPSSTITDPSKEQGIMKLDATGVMAYGPNAWIFWFRATGTFGVAATHHVAIGGDGATVTYHQTVLDSLEGC